MNPDAVSTLVDGLIQCVEHHDPWADKKKRIVQAFEVEDDGVEALEEFISWFNED